MKPKAIVVALAFASLFFAILLPPEAFPDGKSTASAEIELNSRRILPPTLAIAARSAAVGAWLYPTIRCSFDGADDAVEAPAISANTPTASAARNAFKVSLPSSDNWYRSTPLPAGA